MMANPQYLSATIDIIGSQAIGEQRPTSIPACFFRLAAYRGLTYYLNKSYDDIFFCSDHASCHGMTKSMSILATFISIRI